MNQKTTTRRIALATLCTIALVAGVLTLPATPPAHAADPGRFDPGYIISDETFYNDVAMSADDISSFLHDKVRECRATTGPACLKDYVETTTSKAADAYCAAYAGGTSERAATIIKKVATACDINPQVMLVLLQKEQGLVRSAAPTQYMYRSATGYACPDTAPCDSAYYGFFNQVYQAARAFQRYTHNSASYNYRPGRDNQILYHPNATCGTKTVFIKNQATANLYIYTPYTPNAAALASTSSYGLGDGCSSYGNRNFFAYFSDWFGSPANLLNTPSFEGGAVAGWGASNGFINQQVYTGAAADGSWFLAANTPSSGRALSQDVNQGISAGEQATVTISLRSEGGAPFSGILALWGLGATAQVVQTPFSVGPTWQDITVSLPVRGTDFANLRVDLYMTSVGNTLWIDNARMTLGEAPVERNLLRHPSFEASFDGWGPANGFINQQVHQDARARHGAWFAASNTPGVGRSFAQDFSGVRTQEGERYTFSVWLRSSDPAVPFRGTVALWSLGAQRTPSFVPYETRGEWTKVSVTVDVDAATAGSLRAEVYMDTVGATLWLDDAALSRNILRSGSFENNSMAGWAPQTTSMYVAVHPSGAGTSPAHGSYYLAMSKPSTGSGSLFQDVAISPAHGSAYVAEVWLRSSSTTARSSGTVAVWTMGGAAQLAQSPFSVDSNWTRVAFEVPITRADVTSMRFEIYLNDPGLTLYVDSAQLY